DGPDEQRIFRDGMRALDEASKQANGGASFMQATPAQRLALLTKLDQEQKAQADAQDAADRRKKGLAPVGAGRDSTPPSPASSEKFLPDQRAENAPAADAGSGATPITGDTASAAAAPKQHYFRMMKQLAMLGYFAS